MKLAEHTDLIRQSIEKSFDKLFSRMGLGAKRIIEKQELPMDLWNKREKLDLLIEDHKKETGRYEGARAMAMDELTFTLFNRIAAIKVMEAHMLFPEIITKRAEHGDRSFGHKAWLEENPEMQSEELEGLRQYIKYAFNQLGEEVNLYHRDYPYALLPHVIDLNEIFELFNAIEKDNDVEEDIWKSEDVLGWLYESYNNSKKAAFKESDEKVEYDKVSLQSQVYTPRWVVKFLVDNSLGKLYLEMYPYSEIKDKYQIANAPETQIRERMPLHEVKLIDPASGSGNFLFYAFDLFYDLYVDQVDNYGADYNENDIPKLIIENNIHGIDLDDRAIQIAQLGLYIKAKRKKRTTKELEYHIVSSNFFLPTYEAVKTIFEADQNLDKIHKQLIKEIWEELRSAYKFGSLIRIGEKVDARLHRIYNQLQHGQLSITAATEIAKFEEFEKTFFQKLEQAVEQYASVSGNAFLADKTKAAILFLKLLTTKYDVATANPPYTDSADFGGELKSFIEANYKKPYKFHTNLYASFIKRCFELTHEKGKLGLIHPHTFMFIKSFEDVRKYMIDKSHIDVLVDYGLDRVNLFGPGILLDATFYVLSKNEINEDGLYFNLTTNLQEKFKKGKFLEALNDYIIGRTNERVYELEQSKLKIIKSWPFIYWISDEFREKFEKNALENFFKVSQGMSVSNGERFLRFNWEIENRDIINLDSKNAGKWARFPKGGPYKKWEGNLWLCVNWADDGQELRNYKKAVLRNERFYFLEGLTYSSSGSKGTTFRCLPTNAVISGGGPGIHQIKGDFSIDYCLGYLNSKFVSYIISCLNPTVNTTQGDLNRIPILDIGDDSIRKVEVNVNKCKRISAELLSFSFVEKEYRISPLQFRSNDFISSIRYFLSYENYLNTLRILFEAQIDHLIISNISLPENDKEMLRNQQGGGIGVLPVVTEAKQSYLTNEIREFPLDEIREYIQNLPEKEFSQDERLVIASEFPQLYQSNNDLEEFCIRHQINPINVWYWFKQSDVIPKQRMNDLAMEFLADLLREILMQDEDGLIPLVPNAGEQVLLDRIEAKFIEKGFSMAQYHSFHTVLGRDLNEYINNHFFRAFSDHLNLFMYLPKTPFIWHLTSGPEQGFDCYLIIYKWNRDKLYRLKSVYIENRERALENRQLDLANDNSAKAQAEKDKIFKQLKEIKIFKEKIDELLEEGYDPILDDGVGKNIAPLQKKGMLAYEVLNAGQLKKYLNADW